jgi:hypothetical protein
MEIEKEHCAHGITVAQGSWLPGQAWPSLASPAPRPLEAHDTQENGPCAAGAHGTRSPTRSATNTRGVARWLTDGENLMTLGGKWPKTHYLLATI